MKHWNYGRTFLVGLILLALACVPKTGDKQAPETADPGTQTPQPKAPPVPTLPPQGNSCESACTNAMKILRVEAQKSMAKLGPDGIDAMLKRAHGQCVSNCVKQDAAYVGCLGKAATPDDIKGCTSAAAAKATPPKATPTPPQPQGQNPPDPRCNGACQHAVALLQPEMAKAAAGQDKPDMLPRMMEKARQMCVYQCSQAPEVAECLINSKTLEDVRTCKPNDRAAGNKTAPKGPLKVKTLKTTPIVTANPKGAVPVVSGDAKLCPDACANAMGIQVDQYRKKNGPQGKNLNETQLVNMLNAATKTCIEQCNANPSAVHCNLKAKSIGDLRKCVK